MHGFIYEKKKYLIDSSQLVMFQKIVNLDKILKFDLGY
jgi:hypothetical protein